jgi:hypothetical protein
VRVVEPQVVERRTTSKMWSTWSADSTGGRRADAAQREMKRLLGAGRRAASVRPEAQLLDAFAVDCLTSTRTWYAYQLATL